MQRFKKQKPVQSKFHQMKKMPMFPLMPILPLSLMAGSLITSILILIHLRHLTRSMEERGVPARTGHQWLGKMLPLLQK